MIILAIYYTIADIVLLGQCFYYRGFTWRDDVIPPPKPPPLPSSARVANERTALLLPEDLLPRERRGSDWSSLSPVMPMVSNASAASSSPPAPTRLQAAAFNTVAVLMVCGAGVAGWFLSRRYGHGGADHTDGGSAGRDEVLVFDLWGQVFGWLCAALYLGSRLPQLLLNWRRKSTEGVSMLFFLFACLGNLTYVLSIFAYDPPCRAAPECEPGEAEAGYWQYILVNLSWLAGSLGTLLLDLGIFVQFFIYSADGAPEADADVSGNGDVEAGEDEDEDDEEEDEEFISQERWDPRPLLERNMSNYSR